MSKESKYCQNCAPNPDLVAFNINTISKYMTNGSYIKLPEPCIKCHVKGIWKTRKGNIRLRTNIKPFIKPESL